MNKKESSEKENRRETMMDRIEWITEQCKGKDVLNIGCVGEIDWIPNHPQWLHGAIGKRARSLVGIDIDRMGIEKLRKYGYDAIYADAQKFVSKHSVDVVVAGAILEHLDNSGLFLDCAYKSLCRNGRLVVTTYNARNPSTLFDYVGSDYVQLYTPKTLKQLLERHRFKVVQTRYLKDYPPTNLFGKLFERVWQVLPQFAHVFGVVAIRETIKKRDAQTYLKQAGLERR